MNTLFGERLKELRTREHLRQADLSEATKFSVDSIVRWEKGVREPKGGDLRKLAQFFKTSTSYLLGETDDTRPISEQKSTSIQIHDANYGAVGVGQVSNYAHPDAVSKTLLDNASEDLTLMLAHFLSAIGRKPLEKHQLKALKSMMESGLIVIGQKIDDTERAEHSSEKRQYCDINDSNYVLTVQATE